SILEIPNDHARSGTREKLARTMGMPRQPRLFFPGLSAHVIHRGVNRLAIFDDEQDHRVFLRHLRDATAAHDVAVHAFALMKTHYHLLVTPGKAVSLPRAMKQLGLRYVRYFNSKYERIGTLWTGRYRGLPIGDDTYWLTCLRYIELNPVHAGVV